MGASWAEPTIAQKPSSDPAPGMRGDISGQKLPITCLPGPQVVWATQDDQGKRVPVTPMCPKDSGSPLNWPVLAGIWDQLRLVVRDRDTWFDVWKRLHSLDPRLGRSSVPLLPEIDFSREIVVVAAMGSRPTSGYFISIDRAYERDNLVEVVVRSVENRGSGLAIPTAPLVIVRLPKPERSVKFREIEVAPDRR